MTLARELEARQNVDYTRRRFGGDDRWCHQCARLDTLKFTAQPTPPTPDSLDAWTQRAEDAGP